MVYVLMLLSPILGWHIAPIEGNPYPTFKACTDARNIIRKYEVHTIDGQYFNKLRCVPTKKREKENK